jgi:aryl-alcohol dehydrogenase-like predicted oxidoreductase
MAAILDRPSSDILARPMPKRRLGRFDHHASILTMGGVKWDTECNDAEVVELMHRAIELGINTFDTAYIYGDGESESKLGIALEGRRNEVWVETKVMDRTYDGAMKQMDESFKRLRMDMVDLMFVHAVDSEEHYEQIMAPNSVLKAVEEMKAAGRIRHIGVSGHWVRDTQIKLLREYPFEAVLFPAGVFQIAYNYTFVDTVLPVAREQGCAVLCMKAFAAGRIKKASDKAAYLRYSMSQPVDTVVLGMDNMAQLEENVAIAKSDWAPMTDEEARSLVPEALEMTQEFDHLEFPWIEGYTLGHGL